MLRIKDIKEFCMGEGGEADPVTMLLSVNYIYSGIKRINSLNDINGIGYKSILYFLILPRSDG